MLLVFYAQSYIFAKSPRLHSFIPTARTFEEKNMDCRDKLLWPVKWWYKPAVVKQNTFVFQMKGNGFCNFLALCIWRNFSNDLCLLLLYHKSLQVFKYYTGLPFNSRMPHSTMPLQIFITHKIPIFNIHVDAGTFMTFNSPTRSLTVGDSILSQLDCVNS